jgi:ribonucleoside-diphosphate reductase alpha chain
MNQDNPVADIIPYTSTPPCSEMGLSPGETCQFGYLNIASMLQEDGAFNWQKLEHATQVLTRALDNAVEASMDGFPDPISKEIALFKRKIGIGICGIADILIRMKMSYESTQAQQFVRNILSFINYTSKVESVELARRRGSCEAMTVTIGNKYYSNFLLERHGKGTDVVSRKNWQQLNDSIIANKHLRNILTTALPPTGRASILLGVTSCIEPIFAASGWNNETRKVIIDFLQEQFSPKETTQILKKAQEKNSFQGLGIKNEAVLKIAKEISPHNHLKMMEVIAGHNGVCDETVSKTVNLAHNATVDDVYQIFIRAYQSGLKNISIYRDKTHKNQPQKL